MKKYHVHLVYSAGIWTHNLSIWVSPITIRPGLPPNTSFIRAIKQRSLPVWPDWAKFRPFGTLLKTFGDFENIDLVFRIILS